MANIFDTINKAVDKVTSVVPEPVIRDIMGLIMGQPIGGGTAGISGLNYGGASGGGVSGSRDSPTQFLKAADVIKWFEPDQEYLWVIRMYDAPVAGLDKDSAREPLASRFYQRRLAVARGQHAVERLRQLFAVALGYQYWRWRCC